MPVSTDIRIPISPAKRVKLEPDNIRIAMTRSGHNFGEVIYRTMNDTTDVIDTCCDWTINRYLLIRAINLLNGCATPLELHTRFRQICYRYSNLLFRPGRILPDRERLSTLIRFLIDAMLDFPAYRCKAVQDFTNLTGREPGMPDLRAYVFSRLIPQDVVNVLECGSTQYCTEEISMCRLTGLSSYAHTPGREGIRL